MFIIIPRSADISKDNQKRWLIVGICLQNIISPTLRTYTEPIIINLYCNNTLPGQQYSVHSDGMSLCL
jgi:hypothetical protein